LIQDTLLRVSQHKRELKKPLKVQFLGEDGIDEGGVQKEFFQLIMAQIFDVAYGMFEYDADTRVFWFNRPATPPPHTTRTQSLPYPPQSPNPGRRSSPTESFSSSAS